MSDLIITISSEAEFKEASASGVVLVDFFAPWCGPCRMQLPILETLASKVEGTAKILKVNTDEFQSLAQSYEVSSIPTLVLLYDGNTVQRFVGLQQEEALESAIRNVPK